MPYPVHALFSFGGDLMTGKEQWSNNIRFSGSDIFFTDSVGQEPAILAYLMGKLSTRFGSLGYSTSANLKWGKFNMIGEDGRYRLATQTVRQDLTTPVVGTGTAIGNLPQAALAVTFRTDAERGYASKGRVFVPMPAVTVDSVGQMNATLTSNLALAWAALLSEFNDNPIDTAGTDLWPGIVSGVQPVARKITHVVVGSVVDTMRSRRSALVENYGVQRVVTDA